MTSGRVRNNYLITQLVALGFWTAVCLVDSTWYYFVALTKEPGPPAPWIDLVVWNLPYWIAIIALTPPVAWLSRRASFTPGRRWQAVAVHLVSMLAFAIAHVLGYRILRNIFIGKPAFPDTLLVDMRKYIASVLDKEILLYLVIVIAVSAIDYYRQFREKEKAAAALELEQARLKASLSEAHLNALKSQLQPHFLFNALHAISTLIMRGDAQAANQMLLHLSRFLRMTLDSTGAQEVPLEVELEFLDAYLRIQHERFGDRLRIEMNIPPGALRALVPNLVLQPLAENAISHGIATGAGTGTLTIQARATTGRLHLSIADDGPGLGSHPPPEGVGLRNIRARLAQLYPGDHSFTLANAPTGGTVATLSIPLREPPDTGKVD